MCYLALYKRNAELIGDETALYRLHTKWNHIHGIVLHKGPTPLISSLDMENTLTDIN
jgi:hypothetical protein